MVDVDGNRRIDFVNNASALILGHAHRAVAGAIAERAARGTAYFAPCPLEVSWRSCSPSAFHRWSGCVSAVRGRRRAGALRAARAFTGRPMIAKFEGAYHGIDDPALISYLPPLGPELGPAERPLPVAASAGLAPGTAEHVLVLPFNDSEACEALIGEHADRLAAVIVDPLSTAAGMTLPAPGFLETLRRVTREAGIVLIFDEVVSFRAGRGGTQGVYGIRPDLTCLAKVVAAAPRAGHSAGAPTSWRCTTRRRRRGDSAVGHLQRQPDRDGGGPGNPAHHDRRRLPRHPRTHRPARRGAAGGSRRRRSSRLRGRRGVAVSALLPSGSAAQLPRGGAGRRRAPALALLLADEPRAW